MKRSVIPPFFEVGVKNYLFGEDVLDLALAADRAAHDFDIDVLMITPYFDIRRVRKRTSRLVVLAPHMDDSHPGPALADVLPEAVKAAGAHGVVLNHAERPLPLSVLRSTMRRADELELLTFVCSDSIEEARAVAQFGPDIMNPEPTADLGRPSLGNNWTFMRESMTAIAAVDPNILVEQAAGIHSPEQVYNYILAGADGVGAASGIVKSAEPARTLRDMVAAVRRASDDKTADTSIAESEQS